MTSANTVYLIAVSNNLLYNGQSACFRCRASGLSCQCFCSLWPGSRNRFWAISYLNNFLSATEFTIAGRTDVVGGEKPIQCPPPLQRVSVHCVSILRCANYEMYSNVVTFRKMNAAFCSYVHLNSACETEYVKCILSCKPTQHTIQLQKTVHCYW